MTDISHQFNTFQNKDDVLIRNILVGTLHAFKDKLYWYNVVNSEKTKVEVPVYFTVAGSERFLSDIFLNEYKLDKEGQHTEGPYNKWPRAHVSMENFSIQEEYLTNKFTRANFLKQTEDGEVLQYNAEFQNMPLKIDMQVTIFVDSIVDIFKCMQAAMQNMYKNVYYYVDTFNIKVPCHFFIPDTINKERPMNFSFTDKKEIKVTFGIEVHADYPLFKEETEFFAGTKMNSIIYTVRTVNSPSPATRENPADAKDSRGAEYEVTKDIWPTGNNEGNFYPNGES